MSDPAAGGSAQPPQGEPGGYAPSVAERFSAFQRAGGLVVPLITILLAFLIAGLVVLVTTGHNPLSTYRAIFNGTGLVWFFHPGNYSIGIPFTEATVWFPWDTNSLESRDAYALQQTLLLTTTLIFTGLAVAFAFRCGLFNIGGQGQYIAGSLAAVWVGSSFASMAQFPHVVLGIAAAALAGAFLAGIAGFLKATVGAHEVVVTIMLNWIMFWTGQWLLGSDGPLNANIATSTSEDVADSGKLPTFWGLGVLQGAHVGIFLGIAALVVYAIVLNRTTLGYEVRAVGHSPDAARYGGISVGAELLPRHGDRRGLRRHRRLDGRPRLGVPGRSEHDLSVDDRVPRDRRRPPRPEHRDRHGPRGSPLRRPTHGNVPAQPRPGDLQAGAREQPDPHDPGARRALRRRRPPDPVRLERAEEGQAWGSTAPDDPSGAGVVSALAVASRPVTRLTTPRAIGVLGIALGLISCWLALPPIHARGLGWPAVFGILALAAAITSITRGGGRVGWGAVAVAIIGMSLGIAAQQSGLGNLDLVFAWSVLLGATLRYATPLAFAAMGGLFSERSGVVNIGLEGMMLMGAFFGFYAADKFGSWSLGLVAAMLAGAALAAVHAFFCIHLRADQIVVGTGINFLALGITGYAFVDLYGDQGSPTDVSAPGSPVTRLRRPHPGCLHRASRVRRHLPAIRLR